MGFVELELALVLELGLVLVPALVPVLALVLVPAQVPVLEPVLEPVLAWHNQNYPGLRRLPVTQPKYYETSFYYTFSEPPA